MRSDDESTPARIAVWIEPTAFERLRLGARLGAHVEILGSFALLLQAIRVGAHDVILVAPRGMRDDAFTELLHAIRTAPTPVILYVSFASIGTHRLLLAITAGVTDVVLEEYDASGVALRERCLRAASTSSGQLMRRVSPRLADLPQRLSRPVLEILCGAPIPRNVASFAMETGIERRTLDRWIRRGGIRSASTLIDVIRVHRFWELVHGDAADFRISAQRVGFANWRAAGKCFARLAGRPLRQTVTTLSNSEFVDLLACQLMPAVAAPDRHQYSSHGMRSARLVAARQP